LISHTHWDREWYLPFQEFRLKLVRLIDGMLDLLARDRGFRHFMLDGQTIVLEDYLALRPDREREIAAHVRSERLLIGPWFVLPDEFLVSPEAILRNLLEGRRIAARFGRNMPVGYIPDPFGHIAQMPQILRGFGIETACVQRGLDDQPCEFWWQSPDGSQVLMAYLRDDKVALFRFMEKEGLLDINTDTQMAGPRAYGYVSGLPDSGHTGPLVLKDLWGWAESQESVNISPAMFKEFVLPYLADLSTMFGLVYYGCCEPVHDRLGLIMEAIRDGAVEIDMVINVGALKAGDYDFVERDIATVVNT
jgi:hypothetical protein